MGRGLHAAFGNSNENQTLDWGSECSGDAGNVGTVLALKNYVPHQNADSETI